MIGCRAVLILTALLILLMPLTEHLYAWDKFLQGGPDVEFGILCLLLFAGLVLLMAHRAVTSPLLVLLAHRDHRPPVAMPETIRPGLGLRPSGTGNSSRLLGLPRNPAPDLIPYSSSIISASLERRRVPNGRASRRLSGCGKGKKYSRSDMKEG